MPSPGVAIRNQQPATAPFFNRIQLKPAIRASFDRL
jgi:hypothetical protein